MALTLTRPVRQGGRWAQGQSGHPGGKPRPRASLAELCQAHTEEAVKTLIVMMRFKGPNQLPATLAILDRGHGRPAQRIETQSDSVHLHLLAALQIQPLEAPQQQPEQQRQAQTIDAIPTE